MNDSDGTMFKPVNRTFVDPKRYLELDLWHRMATRLRRHDPVHRVEVEGFDPFYALNRHSRLAIPIAPTFRRTRTRRIESRTFCVNEMTIRRTFGSAVRPIDARAREGLDPGPHAFMFGTPMTQA